MGNGRPGFAAGGNAGIIESVKHSNMSIYNAQMTESSLQREIQLLHAEICQALADPTRIALLYMLDEGTQCVTDLAEGLDVPQPTVSYHLRILRERGLVIAEREGTMVLYSLADRRIVEALDMLRGMLADLLTRRAELMREAQNG